MVLAKIWVGESLQAYLCSLALHWHHGGSSRYPYQFCTHHVLYVPRHMLQISQRIRQVSPAKIWSFKWKQSTGAQEILWSFLPFQIPFVEMSATSIQKNLLRLCQSFHFQSKHAPCAVLRLDFEELFVIWVAIVNVIPSNELCLIFCESVVCFLRTRAFCFQRNCQNGNCA